nr:uncharacterized protein I303_01054 [Kwoniella dejecticola CBS 10117]OBR89229.1 hypothetical protein I303_01054 [Kwoniella dejecticola CBS 10117]
MSSDTQAGPSTSRIVLGPPISPTSRILALPGENNDMGLDSVHHSPSTPRVSNRSLPITPPMSPRAARLSLDSSHSYHSASTSRTDLTFTRITPNTHQRSTSLSHKSSYSSIERDADLEDCNRCRVSFDATPLQPSVSSLPSIHHHNSHSRKSSRGSLGQIHDGATQQSMTPEDIPPERKTSVKKARFLEAPLMTRADYGTSSNSRRSYISAFTGEEDPELYAQEFRVPIDENIRSVPGVVGLGEGWAGGPQLKSKKKWFSRRTTIQEDPLALWNQDKATSPNISPLKGLWSKSKRNLFGQSSPALLDNQGESGPPRSLSRMGKLFSLSRSNLTSPDSSPSRSKTLSSPMRNMSKGFGIPAFSSSEVTLHESPRRAAIPSSPSMPALTIIETHTPKPEIRRRRQYSHSTLARSEGDLTAVAQAVPEASSSEKRSSLRPPWRPASMVLTGRTSMIMEPDREITRISRSSTSIETPNTCDSSGSSNSQSKGHALTRTATFGLDDIATEQRIDEEIDLADGESVSGWVQVGLRRGSAASVLDPDKNKPLPRVPSPHRRPSMKQRKQSWIKKVKNALTPSSSSPELASLGQTVDRLLTRRKSSKEKSSKTSNNLENSYTGIPHMEPLKTSPTVPRRKSSKKAARRSSWMVRSTSSLSRRLSRLTEHEEGEHDHELDIQDVDHANRLSSDINYQNFQQNIDGMDDRSARARKGKQFLDRRRSSNFSLLGMKSRRSSCVHALDNIDGLPASVSMPALSKLTTTDLNLHVDLEGEELGLEDILDEERRGSIVHSLGCSTPQLVQSSREEAIQSTLDTLSAKSPIVKPKISIYQESPVTTSYRAKMQARHNSLPLTTAIENNTRHRRNTTVSTINSSPSPSLITPRHPGELATFLHALTFIDAGVDGETGEYSREQRDQEMIIPSKAKTKVPRDLGSAFDHNHNHETPDVLEIDNSLHVPIPQNRRYSTSTHRLSGESYLTQPSLYDTEEVVHGQAIRVDSIGDFQKQASVISLEELGKNWSGGLGLQMTKA